jgi:hypothetical protein
MAAQIARMARAMANVKYRFVSFIWRLLEGGALRLVCLTLTLVVNRGNPKLRRDCLESLQRQRCFLQREPWVQWL